MAAPNAGGKVEWRRRKDEFRIFCNYSAAIGMDFELRFGLDTLGKELTRWLAACQISQNFLFKIKTR